MVSLIALISSGKGSWAQVNSLISSTMWDKIILVCSEFAYNKYESKLNNVLKLKFDEKNIEKDFEKLSKILKKEIKDFEIAVNLYSGNGFEHMALISSVLKAGLGLRFVYIDKGDLKEFELLDEKFLIE
jgi:hypothetical protein